MSEVTDKAFDAGWCNALMHLNSWIMDNFKDTVHIKQIRSEIVNLLNDTLKTMPQAADDAKADFDGM